jgi:hypothetical protein
MSKSVQQTLYFLGVIVVGGALWAVGQSWARGVLAVGVAAIVFLGASMIWNRNRRSR